MATSDIGKGAFLNVKNKDTGEIEKKTLIPPAPSDGDLGGISEEELAQITTNKENISSLRENLVVRQKEQPTDPNNNVWISDEDDEVEVPDMGEFNSLKEDLVNQENKLEPIVKSNEDSKDAFYIVDADGNIICKVDKDGVHSVGFDGKNLALNDVVSTYEDSFYISDSNGNVIFKADKDGVRGLNMSNTSSAKSPYNTKKLVSIGDSLSAHDKWQKWLVEWLGVSFDIDVNINGKDGHAPMAKGGTAIFPDSADSIYIRALDAHYYNPDIIVLYAGQNDIPHFGSETDLNESSVGTINDIPYKKTVPYTDLRENEYKDYTAWYEGRPTLYSYCMGLVENLLTSCPTAKVYVVTPMQMWTSTGEQSVGRKQLVTVWENICNKYGLPIVNLWSDSCVNAFNIAEYYPNVGNVHPNDFGYKRIAETIYSKI